MSCPAEEAEEMLDEARIESLLVTTLEDVADEWGASEATPVRARVSTFTDAGLLTSNADVVLRIGDAEYQITIVRSR